MKGAGPKKKKMVRGEVEKGLVEMRGAGAAGDPPVGLVLDRKRRSRLLFV